MSNPNVHIVNGQVYALRKKSKWTWEAIIGADQECVATDKSRPKLKAKLDNMFSEASKESNLDLGKALKAQNESAKSKKRSPALKTNDEVKNRARKIKGLEPSEKTKKFAAEVKERRKSKKPKSVKKESMRAATLRLIKDGDSDEEILRYIDDHYTDKKYNMSHVKWYRSNFAKTGLIEPRFAPTGSKMYKQWKDESEVAPL